MISTKVAENISNSTDNELIELTTECIQSLGSDNDSDCDSSSSDSSGETERKKVKKTHTGSLLTRMPKSFDRTNPYNSMWIQQRQLSHQALHCAVCRDLMIGGAHRSHAMPQQQHDIFHAQVYEWSSLEMSGMPPPPPQATVQVSKYATHDETDYIYLNAPAYQIGYDSPGHSLNNINPNLIQLQFLNKVKTSDATDIHQTCSESPESSNAEIAAPLFSSTPCSPDNTSQDEVPDNCKLDSVSKVIFQYFAFCFQCGFV